MSAEKKPAFKRELFDQFARIELLDLLSQTERTVEELADLSDMSVANVAQHLQVLRRAQMVTVRREGLYAHYRLADESVFRLWRSIRELGETRLAEVERVVRSYLRDRQTLEPVTGGELQQRLRDGSVIVIDVRPEEEYRAGHIPGALSMPVSQLEERWQELPAAGEIAAYCRGPYCVQSDEAVASLKRRGLKAWRLETGLPDWRANGLPVEASFAHPAEQ